MGKAYKVEDVVGKKEVDGVVMYRIKWEGYPSWQNTWQPIENISPELVSHWEEKQATKKIMKEKKEQEVKQKEVRREYWWHEMKILKHYQDEEGELLFEILKENKVSEVTHQLLLTKNSRVLAKYYIELAKKQGIY